ncbi:MAG: hypothetical protein WC309_02360 [Candidatus Paceibacterota bacterium]|jgi:hypothetical protein
MKIIYEITIGELINLIILAVTGFIVCQYTRAAQKSNKIQEINNEIQEKPILNLYLRKHGIEDELRLRNVGKGPAYNIKFSSIEADHYKYYPYFEEPNPILEKDVDEKTIKHWVETPEGGVEAYDPEGFNLFLTRLFSSSVRDGQYESVARSAGVFLITYEGMNGQKYHSIFRIYSKIVPLLPGVYDLVVQFMHNGKGICDITTAKRFCEKDPIMKKNKE